MLTLEKKEKKKGGGGSAEKVFDCGGLACMYNVKISPKTKSRKKRLITSMEAKYDVETAKSGGETNTVDCSGRCTVAY